MPEQVPFESAPSCVTDSLSVLSERVKLVAKDAAFNELLVAAYLQGQAMNVSLPVRHALRSLKPSSFVRKLAVACLERLIRRRQRL